MKCDTHDCEYSATRFALWRRADGSLTGGLFCAECAERLERAGDEVGPIAA